MIKVKQAAHSLCMILGLAAVTEAAELLDVKPVVSGNSVEIQITSDIPMTYTFYKIPGQARAVVDIADADPEKVEPLIVVNKGIVSSISVDKAQISGMIVSRIIFNLASESDINVLPATDHKLLSVTFASPVSATPVKLSEPVSMPVNVTSDAVVAAKAAPVVDSRPSGKGKEDDLLGLDEPVVAPVGKTVQVNVPDKNAIDKKELVEPVAAEIKAVRKIEPVVPVVNPELTALPSVIKGIVVAGSYIDVQANSKIENYKLIKLVNPVRLAIDIPLAKSSMTSRSIPVGRMGIDRVRVGNSAASVRIVLDSAKPVFPQHTVASTVNGLRITFE